MTPTYASDTKVSPDRSRAEIERILQRYGCEAFAFAWEGDRAMIAFKSHARQVRFFLPVPKEDERSITHTKTGMLRSKGGREAEYDKAIRQRWRALVLSIKAKLESVESGIVTFDEEFLAHLVLPDGTTAGEWMGPQIEKAYETGEMPSMLPQLEAGE